MQLLLIHIVLTSCFTSSQTNVDHGIFADGGALCPHKKKDLKKLRNIRKVSKPHRMIAQRPAAPPQNESPSNTSRKPLKNINQPPPRRAPPHTKTSPWKPPSDPNTPQTPPNPPALTPLATLHCFNLKLE